MPYLTPDFAAGVNTRLLSIPAYLVPAFNGALIELSHEYNWEEFGDTTPSECAAACAGIVDNWYVNMIGMVIPNVCSSIPDFCLLCDGSVYNRVDYPLLYAALDAAYIIDADTFSVPDLVDRFVMGADDNNADQGGAATVTLGESEIPSHTHSDAGHTHSETIAVNGLSFAGDLTPITVGVGTPGVTGSGSANIQATGGGGAHENLPPYEKITWVIVAW